MLVFAPLEVTLSYLIAVEMMIFLLIAPLNMEVSYSSALVVYVVGWKKGDDVEGFLGPLVIIVLPCFLCPPWIRLVTLGCLGKTLLYH